MTHVTGYGPTPEARLVRMLALAVAVATWVAGISLLTRARCPDGSSNSSCDESLTHPYLAYGWLIVIIGTGFALTLFALSAMYRELIISRRFAELAATGKISESSGAPTP